MKSLASENYEKQSNPLHRTIPIIKALSDNLSTYILSRKHV